MCNEKHMYPNVQMRKEVFISDRLIAFRHMSDPLPAGARSEMLSGGESPMDIDTLIHVFLLNTADQPLVLFSRDVEASWSAFMQNFDIVEAAGGLVLDEQSRLLMIHRYGKWDLPKGKLEPGEDVQEGAMREVIEECGIGIGRMMRPLDPSHHTYVHKGRKCLKRTHWFLFSGHGTPVPQAEEGITAAEWLPSGQVELALQETYASIRNVVSGAFPDGELK